MLSLSVAVIVSLTQISALLINAEEVYQVNSDGNIECQDDTDCPKGTDRDCGIITDDGKQVNHCWERSYDYTCGQYQTEYIITENSFSQVSKGVCEIPFDQVGLATNCYTDPATGTEHKGLSDEDCGRCLDDSNLSTNQYIQDKKNAGKCQVVSGGWKTSYTWGGTGQATSFTKSRGCPYDTCQRGSKCCRRVYQRPGFWICPNYC